MKPIPPDAFALPPQPQLRRFSVAELAEAARQITEYINWDRQIIEDFHRYAQRFGCRPGANVFEFVLKEALQSRGLTLEQFRAGSAK